MKKRLPKLSKYGWSRRQDLNETTVEEDAIRDCIQKVEALGCHVLLTDIVNILDEARSKLADFLESEAYELS